MSQINVTIRLDKDIKENAEALFGELGMNFSTAVNIFARQALRQGGLPFEVKATHSTKDEAIKWLMAEIQKGEDSLQNEPLMTIEESRKLMGI